MTIIQANKKTIKTYLAALVSLLMCACGEDSNIGSSVAHGVAAGASAAIAGHAVNKFMENRVNKPRTYNMRPSYLRRR